MFEPEEQFRVYLGHPLGNHWSGARIGKNSMATVTISNDEDGNRRHNLLVSLRSMGHELTNNISVLEGQVLEKYLFRATSEYSSRVFVANVHLLWGSRKFTRILNLIIPTLSKIKNKDD